MPDCLYRITFTGYVNIPSLVLLHELSVLLSWGNYTSYIRANIMHYFTDISTCFSNSQTNLKLTCIVYRESIGYTLQKTMLLTIAEWSVSRTGMQRDRLRIPLETVKFSHRICKKITMYWVDSLLCICLLY